MRAAVVERYGPPEVAVTREIAEPTIGANDVLVEVVAAAVSSGDARIRGARFPPGFRWFARPALGVRGPRRSVLGGTFSGRVVAIGDKVTTVRVGDDVCGMTGIKMGTHAQFVVVPAAKAVSVPDGVTHDDAAGVLFGGTTAHHFLYRKAEVRSGESVLVIGAAGAVGTNAVQLAARVGAHVSGVCSAANAELVARLGAEVTIDYRQTDVAAASQRYDVVVDTVGDINSAGARALLNPGGRAALIAAGLRDTILARGPIVTGTSGEQPETISELLALVAAGELVVVHDAAFDLDDIAEAYRRVDTGHKVGNVIVHPTAQRPNGPLARWPHSEAPVVGVTRRE